MSTPTKTRTVYINQNGMAVCADHGGDYLRSALERDPDSTQIFTDLDHWMRFDNCVHECETCKRRAR